ncbi:MAG: DUF4968 domain-containing protein [Actinobacteria bacterium]|nr:DUF4968 domain-containing protein [Actinomycetota bacterium]
MLEESKSNKFNKVDKILSHVIGNNKVDFICLTDTEEKINIGFEFCSSDVLHFVMSPRELTKSLLNYMIVRKDFPRINFNVVEDNKYFLIKTEKIIVKINKDPWEFFITDINNKLIFKADRSDLYVTRDLKIEPLGYYTSNNGEVLSTVESFNINPDEHFYGFGEKFTDLDKRRQNIISWAEDAFGVGTEKSYKNIPFFMSTNGYGIFINSTCLINYKMGCQSLISATISIEDSKLDFYVFCHPSFKEIINKYTDLTGKPPVPPKWSFGLWTAGYGYRDQKGAISVCEEYRKCDIPCDVISLDPFWLDGDRWCNLQINKHSFPDFKGFINLLKEKGFNVCLWEEPYVSNASPVYKEGKELGYFALRSDGSVYEIQMPFHLFPPDGPIDWNEIEKAPLTPACGVVDFTNPKAFRWWQEKHKPLIEMGVAVFKTDMGEYAPKDAIYFNGITGKEVHNLYGLLYNRAVFEATAEFSGRKALVWGRTAYAGSQRYPLNWGGDPGCDYSSLACTLRGGLSIGLSGIAFWSHDIAGTGPFEPSPDLFIRWAQFGLFSSHSRLHGLQPREPWYYGEKAVEVFRKYAKLRYRLIPYIYSYAHIAEKTGLPVIRPLILEFQNDPNTYDKDLEYLFGQEFLVAPIYNENGERMVYLPEGIWIDYWTKKEFSGPISLEYSAKLDILPLFVKGDSIIPMGPEMNYVGEKPLDPITLDIYIYNKASFTLYDDDEVITFNCMRTNNNINLTIKGDKIPNRKYILHFNNIASIKQVKLDNKPLLKVEGKSEFNLSEYCYFINNNLVTIKISKPGNIELQL